MKKYLEIESSVDYNAKTVKNNFGKMVFVDEQYETKPADWKQCYRAGKEINDFGKSFAQQWLNELK